MFVCIPQGAVIEAVRSKTGLLDTVRNMLDRACPMLIDAKCIEVLVDLVCTALDADAEGDEVEFEQAKKALQWSRCSPELCPQTLALQKSWISSLSCWSMLTRL